MCGTLIAELSIAAAIVMPVWFLDLAFCPETHRPATTGAFEKPGENLCCLVLHRTAACGDLFLHTVKNIFRNDRLMSPLDTYPLAGVLADTLLIFVGDICFPVMDRIFDCRFILQNAFDLGYGPGVGFSLRGVGVDVCKCPFALIVQPAGVDPFSCVSTLEVLAAPTPRTARA